jgi:hypothetical protein
MGTVYPALGAKPEPTAARSHPLKLLRGAALITALAMLTGCVVVRSWRGEKGADVSQVQPGAKRAVAETALGLPLEEWVSQAGIRYALYEYNAGIPPHPGDAVTAALLDVVTFGIFEFITYKNTGWRHPGEYDRRRAKIVIAYDARAVILGIFGEADELPPDGRSGPYQWPRLGEARNSKRAFAVANPSPPAPRRAPRSRPQRRHT